MGGGEARTASISVGGERSRRIEASLMMLKRHFSAKCGPPESTRMFFTWVFCKWRGLDATGQGFCIEKISHWFASPVGRYYLPMVENGSRY